ncbi:hypothetical protein AB9P05_14350 [Roseivirga sp. BDSF3-8]|uniref:hypothetical protein n=1 Tax=Roseivirga sp. BDSF3-8 TaxID=3241598 RepID=UPI003531AA96
MKYFLTFISLFVSLTAMSQVSTTLVVRAKAKDAKFIGTSIGGAFITIRDTQTGELLASGKTSGSTGNTSLIMEECHDRYQQLSDENTAAFTTTLELEEPRRLTISALAPANHAQAAVLAQTQVWLVPGKHIDRDGIILEIPGFIVDLLTPQTHEVLSGDENITLSANVVMMCGCPVTEGGMWNASEYEIRALIMKDGEQVEEIPMNITEKPNTFQASWSPAESGSYEIIVYAYDSRSGNTGVDKGNVIVR